jgi:hypothetical protein
MYIRSETRIYPWLENCLGVSVNGWEKETQLEADGTYADAEG